MPNVIPHKCSPFVWLKPPQNAHGFDGVCRFVQCDMHHALLAHCCSRETTQIKSTVCQRHGNISSLPALVRACDSNGVQAGRWLESRLAGGTAGRSSFDGGYEEHTGPWFVGC